ncbi:hypothetical protein M378DRAFT_315691 [Amanita muscaria Koide BX008]|uniref:C2H2-type domain-containing protein n=1 Tax=Amanita muscaria (strain Koide BX008) TaxID=946122 RepID=A0A0C2S6V3_AMAMK|nr:hypothetical protein M378DRAFT_315691 [Amanita muscaria Koide BX008]
MSSNITDYSHYLASGATVAAQSVPDDVNYSYHLLSPHPDLPPQGFNHENLNTSYEAQRNCPSPQRYRGAMGTAPVINENGLAAANHDMPFDPFMNNGQPSYYSDFNGVTHMNQALGNMQQFSASSSSANRLTTPASSETIEAERLQPDWGRQMIPQFWQSPAPRTLSYHNPANSSRRKRYMWRCHGCGHIAQTRRDMERHRLTIRHGGRRKHKCGSCKKEYVRKDSLQRHVTRTGCGTHNSGRLCKEPLK